MYHTLSHSIPTNYKPTQATNVYPEPLQSTTHSPNQSHSVPDYARPSRRSTLVNLRPSQTNPPVYPSLSQPNVKPSKTIPIYSTLSHCIPACPKPTQTISAYQANPRPSQTNPKPIPNLPKLSQLTKIRPFLTTSIPPERVVLSPRGVEGHGPRRGPRRPHSQVPQARARYVFFFFLTMIHKDNLT